MTDQRDTVPARPWFELVMREIAQRGWTITELAARARIGRPTVYGWGENRGRPRSEPVNRVADVLGIRRSDAHVLAGIIPPPQLPGDVAAQVARARGLTDEDRARVLDAIARRVEGRPQPPPSGPGEAEGDPSPGRSEQAG